MHCTVLGILCFRSTGYGQQPKLTIYVLTRRVLIIKTRPESSDCEKRPVCSCCPVWLLTVVNKVSFKSSEAALFTSNNASQKHCVDEQKICSGATKMSDMTEMCPTVRSPQYTARVTMTAKTEIQPDSKTSHAAQILVQKWAKCPALGDFFFSSKCLSQALF